MNFNLNCDSLATMASADFELLALRLSLLQGVSRPAPAPQANRSAPAPAKGDNERAYLAKFPSETRLTIGCVAKERFLSSGLETREEIAAACVNKGKTVNEYFEGSEGGEELPAPAPLEGFNPAEYY
jgi:hypothetical protein